MQQHCVGCHNADGIGPGDFTSYDVVSKNHAAIAYAVDQGVMPPWLPAIGCNRYQQERRLTKDEKSIITTWSNDLAPLGDPAKAVAANAPMAQLPKLARIDATVSPLLSYLPKTAAPDDFRCLIVDPKLDVAKYLTGFEVLPGAPKIVHHVLLFALDRATALNLDDAEAGAGWACYGSSGATGLEKVVGGWAPGIGAINFPPETGLLVSTSEVFVMQLHYNTASTGGLATDDLTRVNLQYADGAVKYPALLGMIGPSKFTIPANAQDWGTSGEWYSPKAQRIWAIAPHMHTKGKTISVQLGDSCGINIPRWNFHWQQGYFFTQPVTLPLGSKLKVSCTFDNPLPTPVQFGEGTDNEMCLSFFYVTD